MINFTCTHCGAPLESADDQAGKTQTCETCGKIVVVPGSGRVQRRARYLYVEIRHPVDLGFKFGIGFILASLAVSIPLYLLYLLFLEM